MSSVAARFFPPQVAGAGATVGQTGLPFRIDHDEKFNQTTHGQYTLAHGKYLTGLWGGFNWRYDSGQVAGSVPCYNLLSNDPNSACGDTSTTLNGAPAVDLSALTADEEFQSGLMCNGMKATPGNGLPAVCAASQFSSSLVKIPTRALVTTTTTRHASLRATCSMPRVRQRQPVPRRPVQGQPRPDRGQRDQRIGRYNPCPHSAVRTT